MHQYRSHTCGALRDTDNGSQVKLSGWVHRKRDHGNLVFIDLRDHYGITQCVIENTDPNFKVIEHVRPETVLCLDGEVVLRDAEAINENLPTGKIEIKISKAEVLSESDVLPILVASDEKFPEDLRIKHRYIDLRREKLQSNIKMRDQITRFIRQQMWGQEFNEISTPMLTSSSPEGARDFVVPSRHAHGGFYALPQSPQQFKQLLMIGGFDKYFQIAPCFRDEDLRADRLLVHYQLDVEMSFVERDDVMNTMEKVLYSVYDKFKGDRKIDSNIPRIPYSEAMETYGIDRPDLRNPLLIKDVSESFKDSGFGLFAGLVAKGFHVKAIATPGTADRPRSFYDKLNDWARSEGAGGLGYIIFGTDGEAKGPIAKNLDADRIAAIKEISGANDGDSVFFVCDKLHDAQKFAGKVRIKLGQELDLIDPNEFKFCWVIDFPFYEVNDEGKLDFGHNPFSAPRGGLAAFEEQDPLKIFSEQYDFICNGFELGGGSIRNSNPKVMLKAFEKVGYGEDVVKQKFGALYEAFQYGAPPHGGMGCGLERTVMLLTGEPNLREVEAFPLNGRGQDLMMNAPAELSEEQLRELHIKVRPTHKS